MPDLRIFGWSPEGSREVLVRLLEPTSRWGRAGLHTGDRVVSMNGAAVTTWPEMRAQIIKLHIGDTMDVVVMRPAGRFATRVPVTGYDRPTVTITAMAEASPKQKAIRERWLSGW